MKYSLLELSQNISTSLGTDEFNSIGDSTISRQISEIIRTAYFNIATRAKFMTSEGLYQLTASGDSTLPTLMYRPDTTTTLEWMKYDNEDPDVGDTGPKYEYVTILPTQQFLDHINNFNPNDTNVDSMALSGITYYFKNDAFPRYCTAIANRFIIFDAYKSTIDSTLQNSKTMCYGSVIPAFTMEDSFTPNLDDELFPLLLNEAKVLAFMEIKQQPHPLAMQESKRQWSNVQKDKSLTNKPSSFDQLPNFGRTSGGRLDPLRWMKATST